MLKKNLLLKLSSLMVAGSMLITAPAIIPVAQAATGKTTGPVIVKDKDRHDNDDKDDKNTSTTQMAPSNNATSQTVTASSAVARPTSGMAGIVFINYNGDGLPLNVDFAGTTYIVPVATNNGPGRLQISVAPGSYSYTASLPDPFFNALSRSVDVSAGQVAGLGFYQTIPGLINQHHASSSTDQERNHDSKNEFLTHDKNDQLAVAQSDLTNQAR